MLITRIPRKEKTPIGRISTLVAPQIGGRLLAYGWVIATPKCPPHSLSSASRGPPEIDRPGLPQFLADAPARPSVGIAPVHLLGYEKVVTARAVIGPKHPFSSASSSTPPALTHSSNYICEKNFLCFVLNGRTGPPVMSVFVDSFDFLRLIGVIFLCRIFYLCDYSLSVTFFHRNGRRCLGENLRTSFKRLWRPY